MSLSTCTLGCCEKIKIGIVPSNRKIKLPFDIGFNKIEKFFKNFNVFDCHQGAKVTENKACFLSECFYDQPVACPVIYYWKELFKLIRMVHVFNLLKAVHI